MTDQIQVRLTLKSVPRSDECGNPIPADNRLRALLKVMLRRYGFRVERIEEIGQEKKENEKATV